MALATRNAVTYSYLFSFRGNRQKIKNEALKHAMECLSSTITKINAQH